MKLVFSLVALITLFSVTMLSSCVSQAEPATSLKTVSITNPVDEERNIIVNLLAEGSPNSLSLAYETSVNSTILPTSDKETYSMIAYELARLVYPEKTEKDPQKKVVPDTPLMKAFMDARNGKEISSEISDVLMNYFPLVVVFRLNSASSNTMVLSAYERFSLYGIPSVIAELARGIALERSGDNNLALSAFSNAVDISVDCYPALIGKARVLNKLNRSFEALEVLSLISDSTIGENLVCKRIKAIALYQTGSWDEAFTLSTELLQDDPMDSEMVLVRAHILVEMGDYKAATPLLNAYASVDSGNRLYILLRAKVSMESAKNRTAAINALKQGLVKYPDDEEMKMYSAELFFSGTKEEKEEANRLALEILEKHPQSLRAFKIILESDIENNNYLEAALYADKILSIDPEYKNYSIVYKAYKGAKRNEDAYKIAEAWYKAEPKSESASMAYVNTLIARGQKVLAKELINNLLNQKGSSAFRSSLHWNKSLLLSGEDAILAELRSALIENGKNVDALIAMTDIYLKRNDYQRASFYLKQSFVLSPERTEVLAQRNTLASFGVAIP